jgi:hypothetical protein
MLLLLLLFGAMIAVRFDCSKRVWDNEYRGGKRAQRVSYSYLGILGGRKRGRSGRSAPINGERQLVPRDQGG